jgi:arsenical pump membrane protein
MHETLALLALLGLLVTAVRRPTGLPEVVVAVPAVGLLLAVGAVSFADAKADVERLGPVVGFLAAVLVIAECCEGEGVFRAAGALMARASQRSPSRLLLAVIVLASVTTALLSLDTTVVLLTPVVVATVRANGAPPRPHLYATAHLANSASLLLPVSNLTNLLAFAVVPISFTRFAALMALPWLVAIVVEAGGLRAVFRADFAARLSPPTEAADRLPVFATTVVALTVVGFAVASFFGLAPVWVATAGALVLSTHRLVARRTTVLAVVRSTAPSFCLFVLGLGIVVGAVSADGLGHVVRHLVPSGPGLLALLGVAAVSAVLSNVMNNLPATLLLLPIAAVGGVGPALAVLIGVDIGPNLTYPGSLATLLWRRAVADVDGVPEVADYSRLGVATVPLAIVGSTVALWLSLKVIGAG